MLQERRMIRLPDGTRKARLVYKLDDLFSVDAGDKSLFYLNRTKHIVPIQDLDSMQLRGIREILEGDDKLGYRAPPRYREDGSFYKGARSHFVVVVRKILREKVQTEQEERIVTMMSYMKPIIYWDEAGSTETYTWSARATTPDRTE